MDPHNQSLLNLELELCSKLQLTTDLEVQAIKQKMQLINEKEADRNTKHFHNCLKIKTPRDRIHTVEDMDGAIQSSTNDINEAFINYFASILANPTPHQPNLIPLFLYQSPLHN